MDSWDIENAEQKLEQVIEMAISEFPQQITRNDEPIAYVVSAVTFDYRTKPSIKSVLLNQPHKDLNISWERNPAPTI